MSAIVPVTFGFRLRVLIGGVPFLPGNHTGCPERQLSSNECLKRGTDTRQQILATNDEPPPNILTNGMVNVTEVHFGR